MGQRGLCVLHGRQQSIVKMMRPGAAHTPQTLFLKQGHLSRSVKGALDMARTRLWIACLVFSFCLLAVFVRLGSLTLFQEESGPSLTIGALSQNIMTGRAEILDRTGKLLATTIMTSSLYANAKKIQNAEEVARKLHTLFPHLKPATLKRRLTSRKSFVWIARHLTPHMQSKVLDLGVPGLGFVRDYRRVYPHKNLAAHVVGITDIDNQGVAGLESSFDQRLRTNPDPLHLSLDIRLQHIVRDELQKGVKEFGCLGGSAILLDIRTGEVLSMVSLPDFDPNKPGRAKPEQLLNQSTLGIFEMGSIMKIPNTAMGLEIGNLKLGTTYDTSDPLRVGRFTITDYRAKHGVINVAQIFFHSSNKGSAKIALDIGAKGQKAFLKKLGFLDKADIEISEVGTPLVPKRWRRPKVITISYGYGLAVSPLQALAGIASLAGGGRRLMPTLLKREGEIPYGERLVSEQNSKRLLHLMRLVVTEGASRKAQVPGYFIAGKTGTVDFLMKGQYDKSRSSTTFVGILGETAETVRYALIVRLDDAQRLKKTFGFNAAGWNAAPVAGRILSRIAGATGLKPQAPDSAAPDPFFRQISFRKKQ